MTMTCAGQPCVAQDNPRMNNLETDEGTKQLEMYVPPMQTSSRAKLHHPKSIMSHRYTSEL